MEAHVAIMYPEHDVHLLARHFTSENFTIGAILEFSPMSLLGCIIITK